jgi:hypothetical protein
MRFLASCLLVCLIMVSLAVLLGEPTAALAATKMDGNFLLSQCTAVVRMEDQREKSVALLDNVLRRATNEGAVTPAVIPPTGGA